MDKLKLLDSQHPWLRKKEALDSFLGKYFQGRGDTISVLDAGCGLSLPVDLGGRQFRITGVNISKEAIEARQRNKNDLATAIVGDLRSVEFRHEEFDMVYCCNVVEHVSGAKRVIDRFFQWLKPDGVLVLIFPDRDSVLGFLTRITPHWMHVAYYRYFAGYPRAGKPGHGPFPTVFDGILSRLRMQQYCRENGHRVLLELGRPCTMDGRMWFAPLFNGLLRSLQILSLGKLSADHGGLVYVIRKSG